MRSLFLFPDACVSDAAVQRWMLRHPDESGAIARHWFAVMRRCGDDTREVLHDGQPTACVGEAAFGYVDVFTEHVDVGFYQGAELADPHGLLEGSGRFMRHVKLRPEAPVDAAALTRLIEAAYADVQARLRLQAPGA